MPRTALLWPRLRRASCFAIQEDANPAKRVGAKQVGGGRRTRTFEVIRRLIYSQAGTSDGCGQIGTSYRNDSFDLLYVAALSGIVLDKG
jgi:hypothetical protein